MLEIQPLSLTFPVVKPKKIYRDDNRPEKQQRKKKKEAEKQEPEPMQHIDEIV